MSRIIAGLAGSIKLKSAAKATRPTSDRVKESVFAKLESMGAIEGARVLDLFAGTGALGLEAASRRAAWVTFVEKDPAAASVVSENILQVQKSLEMSSHLTLIQMAAAKFLLSCNQHFDLVFIDPPYEMPDSEVLSNLQTLKPLLGRHPLVLVERSSKSKRLDLGKNWQIEELKTYGSSVVYFLGLTE